MLPLEKQVVPPPDQDPALAAMKRRIDGMQILYVVLFITSLVLILVNWSQRAPLYMHVLWAISLGGAVITRIIRQRMVSRYNAALTGGPVPLT